MELRNNYVDEPLEGVLVHGVDVGEVCRAEEEQLCAHRHWDVLTAGDIDLTFCLLCVHYFGLWRGGREKWMEGERMESYCTRNS